MIRTTMTLRAAMWVLALGALGALGAGCDDGDAGAGGDAAAATDLREGRDVPGRDSGEDAAGDGAAADLAVEDPGGVEVSDDPLGGDADEDGARGDGGGDTGGDDTGGGDTGGDDAGGGEPGPESPLVGCVTAADCPADGADPGACCTEALRYESFCGTEATCTGGQRDACLEDSQCSARRPGSWTVCCHDRGGRNYCAPVRETCEPLRPCDGPADCVGAAAGPCCSYHEYYGRGYCTSSFFAANPDTECL